MRARSADGNVAPESATTLPASEPPAPVATTVIVAPSAGCSLSPGARTLSLYSPGGTVLMVKVPSGLIFEPGMPKDDDPLGLENSWVRLTSCPASGAPAADNAVPEIEAARPGTIDR